MNYSLKSIKYISVGNDIGNITSVFMLFPRLFNVEI